MADDERFSLGQLERRSGVSARQVRELIRLGVLPGASSGGRGATYGAEHLERLRAWKRLRREAPAGTTTEQLRVLLDRLHEAGLLRGVGEGTIPFSLVDDARERGTGKPATRRASRAVPLDVAMADASPRCEAGASSAPGTRNDDALAYLRRMRSGGETLARVSLEKTTLRTRLEVNMGAAQRSGAGASLARLHAALEEYVSRHASPVRLGGARSEAWQRVSAGRDLEIAARGPLDPDDVRLLESVAQLLQQAIYRRREK